MSGYRVGLSAFFFSFFLVLLPPVLCTSLFLPSFVCAVWRFVGLPNERAPTAVKRAQRGPFLGLHFADDVFRCSLFGCFYPPAPSSVPVVSFALKQFLARRVSCRCHRHGGKLFCCQFLLYLSRLAVIKSSCFTFFLGCKFHLRDCNFVVLFCLV